MAANGQADPLQQGLLLLKLAVEKDEALQLDEAVKLYTDSLTLLSYCHSNLLGNAKILMALPSKIKQYTDRLTYLSRQQKLLAQVPAHVPSEPSFASTPQPHAPSAFTPTPYPTGMPNGPTTYEPAPPQGVVYSTPTPTPAPYPPASQPAYSVAPKQQHTYFAPASHYVAPGPSQVPTDPNLGYSMQPPVPQQPVSSNRQQPVSTKAFFASHAAVPVRSLLPVDISQLSLQDDTPQQIGFVPDDVPAFDEEIPLDIPDGPNFQSPAPKSQPDDTDFFAPTLPQKSEKATPDSKGKPGAKRAPMTVVDKARPTKQVIDGVTYSKVSASGTDNPLQMKSDLQMALDLAEQAKELDKKQDYTKALDLYKQSIEFYLDVIKTDLNQQVKTSLTKTVRIYIARAEKIKEYLQKSGQMPPDSPENMAPKTKKATKPLPESDLPESREDYDIRVGPLVKETQTSFWNDSSPLFFRADIRRNLVYPGDTFWINVFVQNRSSIKVARLRVFVRQTELTTVMDVSAKKQVTKREERVNMSDFTQNGVFPMASNTYEGDLEFIVPMTTKHTDADYSTSFAREHTIVIMCDIPNHNDLFLEFPIRIQRV